ncbi:16S rRNA (uracil(1498)-N(3))-methyltransferase [Clostridia bacterium]|nr:16S rRNA (uracil(1498)-N(3))-methyltransferase [Clostridia bacterium]
MANRYYLESMLDEKTALLSQEETHHITKVMRKKIGDQIELLDGENHLFQAEILAIEEQKIRAGILEVRTINREIAKKVFLVQGLCKGDKMDFIVQKATELGVSGIYPVSTLRSDIRLNEEKARKKQERWQKIAKEATKQCRRGVIPAVNPVSSLKDFLAEQNVADGVVLALYEDEKMTSIRDILPKITEEYLYLIVGPEGGFDLKEIEWMKSIGVHSVSLGNRTLRTETAGILGISCVYYEFGDQL